MDAWIKPIIDSMVRYIGQTVTIFTTSGGLSGCGFTGVLLCCDCNTVQLLADVGAAPACPVGSSCCGCFDGGYGGYGYGNGYGNCCNTGNVLGAVCVIPTCAIACFTHNAI